MSDQRDPDHGFHPDTVRLRGGPYDGAILQGVPHRVVHLSLEDHRYFRSHRHASGDASFHHTSIYGRA